MRIQRRISSLYLFLSLLPGSENSFQTCVDCAPYWNSVSRCQNVKYVQKVLKVWKTLSKASSEKGRERKYCSMLPNWTECFVCSFSSAAAPCRSSGALSINIQCNTCLFMNTEQVIHRFCLVRIKYFPSPPLIWRCCDRRRRKWQESRSRRRRVLLQATTELQFWKLKTFNRVATLFARKLFSFPAARATSSEKWEEIWQRVERRQEARERESVTSKGKIIITSRCATFLGLWLVLAFQSGPKTEL